MRATSAAGTVRRVFIAVGALLALVLATGGTPAQVPAQGPAAAQQPPQALNPPGSCLQKAVSPPGRGVRAVRQPILGHGNETFNTNQFKELVTRGFRWALKKEPIALPPPPQPARGGGRGRGNGGDAR